MADIDNMGNIPSITIEVVYALADRQDLVAFEVKQGTTALAAVLKSGLTSKYPEIDVDSAKMGIFSKPLDGKHLPLPQDYQLQHKDRVEIYRSLLIDPKQARLLRAEKARKAKQNKK